MWSEARRLALEISELTPALLSNESRPTVRASQPVLIRLGMGKRSFAKPGSGQTSDKLTKGSKFPQVEISATALPGDDSIPDVEGGAWWHRLDDGKGKKNNLSPPLSFSTANTSLFILDLVLQTIILPRQAHVGNS